MKKCLCGQILATNARACPHCGNRFTHPFVSILAWFFAISIGLGLIGLLLLSSQMLTTVTNPMPSSIAVSRINTGPDEAAWVIKNCGKPDREFTEKAAGAMVRHLVYRKFNTELFFYREHKNRSGE
jgi:hypothetical protein